MPAEPSDIGRSPVEPVQAPPWLQRPGAIAIMGVLVLLLDLLTGPYLAFPILFVIPVTLAAWYWTTRGAYLLTVLLPLGRLFIALFVDHPSPAAFSVINFLIRVLVLAFIASLVSRIAEHSRRVRDQLSGLVTVCAWSKTIKYENEWLSFEEYLKRRFNIDTTHGISPAEAERALSQLRMHAVGSADTTPPPA